jgi:hypothetical protein
MFTKSFKKNLKIKRDQVMLPKTGLSPVGTSGPLGVTSSKQNHTVKSQNKK